MTPVRELIDRVEGATGPDREIDRDLYVLAGAQRPEPPPRSQYWTAPEGHGHYEALVPKFTASVDAALALIERVLPGVWWLLGRGKCTAAEPEFGAQLMFGEEPISVAEAPTPALALVKALLKALDVQDGAVDGSSLHSTRGKG